MLYGAKKSRYTIYIVEGGRKHMKHEATLEAENNYTVAEDELARELLPLVKDYFTAEAEETGRGTLLATFTNGEKFEIRVTKLQ